jgi:hypothetical protein
MTLEHVIEPAEPGTSVVERLVVSGRVAGIFAKLLGKRLDSLLAVTSAHLAQLGRGTQGRPGVQEVVLAHPDNPVVFKLIPSQSLWR